MSVPVRRAAMILLASGLSRRYGRRDKLLESLGGKPLIDYPARVLASFVAAHRVAVCPAERPEIKERLQDRFVIALNQKPKLGLGHSIALGVQVAMQFKPDAIVLCMGDMPFVERWVVKALLDNLSPADVVHAGDANSVHPPASFGAACFDRLSALRGDQGARQVIGEGGFEVASLNVPEPLLVDVDTPDSLAFAERQLAIRRRYGRKRAGKITAQV